MSRCTTHDVSPHMRPVPSLRHPVVAIELVVDSGSVGQQVTAKSRKHPAHRVARVLGAVSEHDMIVLQNEHEHVPVVALAACSHRRPRSPSVTGSPTGWSPCFRRSNRAHRSRFCATTRSGVSTWRVRGASASTCIDSMPCDASHTCRHINRGRSVLMTRRPRVRGMLELVSSDRSKGSTVHRLAERIPGLPRSRTVVSLEF